MLRLKSNGGPAQLELHQAMRCWDLKMPKIYSTGKGDLDWCADTVEAMSNGQAAEISRGPVVGVIVQVCRDPSEMKLMPRSPNAEKAGHAMMPSRHSTNLAVRQVV